MDFGAWKCCTVCREASKEKISLDVNQRWPENSKPNNRDPQEPNNSPEPQHAPSATNQEEILPFRKSKTRQMTHNFDEGSPVSKLRRQLSLQIGDAAEAAATAARIHAQQDAVVDFGIAGTSSGSANAPVKDTPVKKGIVRRNSQEHFAEQQQTIVVFDWDDTVFPTTYVQDESKLKYKLPLHCQSHLPSAELQFVKDSLNECDTNAAGMLDCALSRGKTVIVTLAKRPWVQQSCQNFFPKTGKIINDHDVQVIYAAENAEALGPEERKKLEEDINATEKYWGLVKGRAIATAVDHFYSQYEGQSWKNLLSIGDSTYERYGTMAAGFQYVKKYFPSAHHSNDCRSPSKSIISGENIVIEGVHDGHLFKLRTKVLKMLDDPSPAELAVQLGLICRWLPYMVDLDDGYDLAFEDLASPTIAKIEEVLRVPLHQSPEEGKDKKEENFREVD